MCGGSSKAATRAAEQSEAERQAAIQRSVDAINGIYNDPARQQQIADYQASTLALLQSNLDRQKGDADRSAKFAMARTGLAGGSADVDTNKKIAEQYLLGQANATRQAQGAAAALAAQDQQSKQNLIALAQSGVDATTSAQQAGESLKVNLANAKGQALTGAVDNTFGSFADLYKASIEQAARKDAKKAGAGAGLYDTWGAFGPGGGYWTLNAGGG